MSAPVLFAWDGNVMKPVSAIWARRADKAFAAGEQYPLVVNEERSMAMHRRYFATLNDGFNNLPEADAERFPTVEHLRKYLLIRAGYYTERNHVCETEAEARKLAAFIKPIDDYSVVVARGTVIKVFTAKSQSVRSMPKGEFKASQEKVLDLLTEMIGVEPGQLEKNAGAAA